MRDELKILLSTDLDDPVDVRELELTLDQVRSYHDSIYKSFIKNFADSLEDCPSDVLEAHFDDGLYYKNNDINYIWHYGLWRMQAVFESIIVGNYLKEDGLKFNGLKAKLEAMKEKGYCIDTSYYDELLDWAKIRNVLSHFPPERFRETHINENDLVEYLNLCKKVCDLWKQ